MKGNKGRNPTRISVDRATRQMALGRCYLYLASVCGVILVIEITKFSIEKEIWIGVVRMAWGRGYGERNVANKLQQATAAELTVVNGPDTKGSLGSEHGHYLTFCLLAGELRNGQRPLKRDLCSSEDTGTAGGTLVLSSGAVTPLGLMPLFSHSGRKRANGLGPEARQLFC